MAGPCFGLVGTCFGLAEPFFVMAGTLFVMAGLGPAIHDFTLCNDKSWMPAPRAGMTSESGRA